MDIRRPLAALAWRSRAGAGRQHVEMMPKASLSQEPYVSSKAQLVSVVLEEHAVGARPRGESEGADASQKAKKINKHIEIQGDPTAG